MPSVDGLKTADLVDAMGRLHRHRCHILDLVRPTPGRVLFGPAVTISYFPSCSAALDPDRYHLANPFYEAVGDEPAGNLAVLASNGYTDVSMGGGTKLSRRSSSQVWGCCRGSKCSPTARGGPGRARRGCPCGRSSGRARGRQIPRGDRTGAISTTRGRRGKMTDACTHLDQVQIPQLPESVEGSTTWKES